MSFPRAPLKRFNEHIGCAPPPGTYELKAGGVKGPASFQKAERFKSEPKSTALLAPPSTDVPMSPVRRTMSVDGLTESSKKDKVIFQTEMKHQKQLEKEIRSLVQQRVEQDRRLLALENDLKKLEAKHLTVMREKTGFAANVVSLERQNGELKKTNEFLKSKVSADTTKKRIHSLSIELMETRNKLDAKDKELSFLQVSVEGKVKMLEMDLDASKATISAVMERNKDLEELHQEAKTENEKAEKELDKLHAAIQELREEIKVLQSYLDAANEELQVLRGKLQDKCEVACCVSDSQEKLSEVKQKLEQSIEDLHKSQNTLREKEQEMQHCQQELQMCQRALSERERGWEQHKANMDATQTTLVELKEKIQQAQQELQASQNIMQQQEQELARVREVLRKTEEELDQRVAHMNERCLALEDEKARMQEKSLRRVQELLADISLMKESWSNEMKTYDQLKQKHSVLSQQLEDEKAHCDSLSTKLACIRDEMENERKQLEVKLEEALEELSGLEEQERCHEEAIQHLTEEKHTLGEELNDACAKMERQNIEMRALVEAHEAAMKKLQEEHSNSLGKIGNLAIELDNTKNTLSMQKEEVETRAKQLEDELGRMSQQLQEEQQKRHFQSKELEENVRMLQELQTRMAQSEEEARRSAETHSNEQNRLQGELLREQEGKHRAMAELEQARQRRRESRERKEEEALLLHGQVGTLQQEVAEQHGLLKQERSRLQNLKEEWQQEREQLRQQLEQERLDIARQLTEAQQSTSNSEMEHWRSMYEQLYSKVQPFQEQLDGFAAERDALLNEKGATQAELSKLAGAYANLLGHQNQRQKIKHMIRLKEENLELKQEVSKLRSQITKQKRELEHLKASNAPRKFDPSKAFKHELKENMQPAAAFR